MGNKYAGFVGLVVLASAAGVGLKAVGAPPNIEMLMPFVLAAGLAGGPLYGLALGGCVRGLYDVYQGWAGPWTLLTAPSYAVVGLVVGFAGLRWKVRSRTGMMALAGAATLVYDVLTMALFGLWMGMPLQVLVVGQVPFSIMHVAGNMLFCFLLAPTLTGAVRELVFEESAVAPVVVKG